MKKYRKLLITGCGRSGTKYIAELLKQYGFDIGHEQDGTDGIASWPMTITHGKSVWGPSFQEYEFNTIVHQVRNPIMVISSSHTILDESWNYIGKYMPLDKMDSKLMMCAKYWYYWNLKAERIARLTYRIEDVDLLLPELCNILGAKSFSKEIYRVTPKDVNKRFHGFFPLEKIEDKELYDNIFNLALKYGYKEEELVFSFSKKYPIFDYMKRLENYTAERDTQNIGLTKAVANHDVQLQTFYSNTIWKITKLLRLVGQRVKKNMPRFSGRFQKDS